MNDPYTRHCLKISVGQICQVIGWTSIQSTPLEILTDILEEYVMSLARMTNRYATHYGLTSPGVQHVALALGTFGVQFNELTEYMDSVEAPPVVDVPCYPVHRENHLNLLKPGSREVVTRPVHIHEHLPPVYPHLQDEDSKELTVEVGTNELSSPLQSPKGIFKKPGDPDHLFRRQRNTADDEVRALREITSVMMTTSGFLSPAREGKLPEARTPSSNQATMTNSSMANENEKINQDNSTPFVVNSRERKKKKQKDTKKDIQNQERPAKGQISTGIYTGEPHVEPHVANQGTLPKKWNDLGRRFDNGHHNEDNLPVLPKVAKISKLSKPMVRLPSPCSAPKLNSFLLNSSDIAAPVSKSSHRRQSNFPLQTTSKSGRPTLTEKIKTDHNDTKLSQEMDKQKLTVFKKLSKTKEDSEVENDTKHEESSKWSALDEIISRVSRGNIDVKLETDGNKEIPSVKEESQVQIDVVSTSNNKENFDDSVTTPVEPPHPVEPRVECKKKRREKQKDKSEVRHSLHESSVTSTPNHEPEKKGIKPIIAAIGEQMAKSNLPLLGHDLPLHQTNIPPAFPYYPFPSGVLTHPLIPQGPPVLAHYPLPPSVLDQPIQQQRSTPPPPAPAVPQPPSTITMAPPPLLSSSTTTTSPKKKEHKKIKKLKDKLKKKKAKKEKNRDKAKSEKKRLKLEKKEREKEKNKSKKDKKEKKKEKEHPNENKLEAHNVPKITLKLSPVSQDSPIDTCHRKIVIKPVVKKDEDKNDATSWPSTSVNTPTVTKPHKSQKNLKNGVSTGISSVDEDLKVPPSLVIPIQHNLSNVVPAAAARIEAQSEYICPACNRPDDGSPMIACDLCDLWFHWICVGIQEPPESDWYCRKCTFKMDGISSEKRKKHKKKKSAV